MNSLTKEQLELNKQYSKPNFADTNTPFDSGAIQVSKISQAQTGKTQPYRTSVPNPVSNPPSISYNFYKQSK